MMDAAPLLSIHNGLAFATRDLPRLAVAEFRRQVIDAVAAGGRLAALFGRPIASGSTRLVAVLTRPDAGDLAIAATEVRDAWPAITPHCPQAHWFEREIAEQCPITVEGHPWLKPVRSPPLDPTSGERYGFFAMHGAEVHEVAVGPVHAGVIEPGHFRFQCHGETVYHLEIALGYQHRGVERAMEAKPGLRAIHYMETLAGDTTIGHAHAYCRAMESLAKTRVPARAQVLRGVAAELERIANHVGDLGALAGDVGYLPTMSYCGRLRGDVLNMTAVLCGNRFGRGLLRPGGVAFDLDDRAVAELRKRLTRLTRDLEVAVELLWNTPSVMGRFDGTGVVSLELCRRLGLVGVAARACGAEDDIRNDLPYGIYRFTHIPVSSWTTGDVFARAYVRWMEVQRSLAFLDEQLQSLPEGPTREPAGPLGPDSMVVAMTEGWRGEICHVVATDAAGQVSTYKVTDPSLHNWFGLACALRGQAISDFPLCNKSFNLSYCGHDL